MPQLLIEKEIEIPELQTKRKIRISLPEGYFETSSIRYPVFYMQDGQNLFQKKDSAFGMVWKADEAAKKAAKHLNLPGLIIVGIDCNNGEKRLDEYSPWINPSINQFTSNYGAAPRGGKGAVYAEFLVKTLKPYIDENYLTCSHRDTTWIGGSSMGALLSLYAGFKYQNIFSRILAMSTAIWFAKNDLFSFLRSIKNINQSRVYLDIGTK